MIRTRLRNAVSSYSEKYGWKLPKIHPGNTKLWHNFYLTHAGDCSPPSSWYLPSGEDGQFQSLHITKSNVSTVGPDTVVYMSIGDGGGIWTTYEETEAIIAKLQYILDTYDTFVAVHGDA